MNNFNIVSGKDLTIYNNGNCSSFTTSIVIKGVSSTTSAVIWNGGYVTDNFGSYYLDKDMVKHYDK